MKTGIFSQFFINEKRVFSFNELRKTQWKRAFFSQFFINEKRVFFIQRISQKCI